MLFEREKVRDQPMETNDGGDQFEMLGPTSESCEGL